MASTPTTRNRFAKQGTGDNSGTWGSVLNTQAVDLIDESIDGVSTISLAAGNVTLSSANYATDQARKRVLKLTQTGTPTSYQVTIPSVEKFYVVHNLTSAAQTVKAGGLGVSIPALTMTFVYCDGTDCFAPTATANQVVGMVTDFAGATAPTGWLLCYGQAISRTTYSALFQAIGTAHGVGDGSTTFNVPDLRGRAAFGKDDMGGSTAGRISGSNSFAGATTLGTAGGDDKAQSHTHTITINDSGHSHATNAITGGATGCAAGGVTVATYGGAATINSNVTSITASSSAQVNAGNSGNMPPALILNKIIYAGV